jgi:flagellar biogenesis protein FliO
MRRLLVALVCIPALAAADPSFEIKDRGDAVEVIAHDLSAARTAIVPLRERLEIPLAARATLPRLVPGDATVRLVEIEDGRLSVKLNFEHDDVVALARVSQAIQVGPDLHVLVPRKVPVAGTAAKLPEPTLPPAPPPAPSKVEVVAPEPAKVEPPRAPETPVVAPLAKPVAPPVSPKPAPNATKPTKPTTLASEPETDWKSLLFALVAGGGTLAGGMWLMKRKKQREGAASTIEIVAQRSLGGKARVVWLSAGQRDIIVAVTPQAVRTLGQWRKSDAPAALPAAHVHESRRPEVVVDKPSSPAVAGILRLRQRTEPPPDINEDVATGDVDADALWAKEILMATGARR